MLYCILLLYIYYYYIIIYYILYYSYYILSYTILFLLPFSFLPSFPSHLLPIQSIPPVLSSHPSHSQNTCRHLDILIYIIFCSALLLRSSLPFSSDLSPSSHPLLSLPSSSLFFYPQSISPPLPSLSSPQSSPPFLPSSSLPLPTILYVSRVSYSYLYRFSF